MRFPRTLRSVWFSAGTVAVIGLLPLIPTNHAPSFSNLGLYLLGLTTFLFLPGIFLVRLLTIPVRGIEASLLGITLGIVSSSLAYRLAAFLDAVPLYLAWPAVAVIGLVVLGARRRGSRPRTWTATQPYFAVFLVAVVVVSPLAILPHFSSDLVTRDDGSMRVGQERIQDGLLHISVANELTHSSPPQVPFLAGKPLNYHYGIDVLTAVFDRFAGVASKEICLRYLPALYLALLVVSVFCFTRRWLGSFPAGVVGAFLVVLGEDFSFIPGLATQTQRVWTVHFFQVPTVFSLYWVNPMSLSLAFLFTGLFCLLQGQRQTQRRFTWMLLAGAHFAVMGTFKVFTVLQVLLALFLVAVLSLKGCKRYWLKTFLVTLTFALIITAPVVVGREEASVIEVRPDAYSQLLPSALERLRLSEVAGFRAAIEMFDSRSPSFAGMSSVLLLALPVFIVGSFGTRVIGIPAMLRSLSWRTADPLSHFMAWYVLCGCLLTFALKVTPIDSPDSYNNSVWFFVQSKYVAWLFAVQTATRWYRRGRERLATAGTLLI